MSSLKRGLRNSLMILPLTFGMVACGGLPPGTDPRRVYKNIPGNEFPVIFTSSAAPEGRTVMIDPDDLMPVPDDRDKKLSFTFRANFLSKINDNLPNAPGGPSVAQLTAMKEQEGAYTIRGEDTASLFIHLRDNHHVPVNQIWGARRRAVEIRLRDPAFKSEEISAYIYGS